MTEFVAGGGASRHRDAMIATNGLTLTIGGVGIVSDVSLDVAAGEFVGVIGPNGAGKTTLLNLLSGLATPTDGAVRLSGRDVTRWPAHRRVRAGLGRTFQTSSVFPALSVFENVRLAAQARLGGNLRIWRRADAVRDAVDAAREALAEVGLDDRAAAFAGVLPHGDKRKLELAILLAGRPAALLLDEPMAGVSAEDVPGLTELIGSLHARRGVTVMMVEHHIDVVLHLADRIAVMHHGALLAIDSPDAVMANATVQNAYLGQAL